MIELTLKVENKSDGLLHGTVEYEDDVLLDCGRYLEQLESRIKGALKAFHNLEPGDITFKVEYI